VVEKAKVEWECSHLEYSIEVPTRDCKVSSHHTVTYQMTSVEDDNIMQGISSIMRDIENLFPCPSMQCNQLKEVPQRDVDHIFSKIIKEALMPHDSISVSMPLDNADVTDLRHCNHPLCLICRDIPALLLSCTQVFVLIETFR
jgi:hypothetical protein